MVTLFTSDDVIIKDRFVYSVFYLLPFKMNFNDKKRFIKNHIMNLNNILDKESIYYNVINFDEDKLYEDKKDLMVLKDSYIRKEFLLNRLQDADYLICDLSLYSDYELNLEELIVSSFYFKEILGKISFLLYDEKINNELKKKYTDLFSINEFFLYKLYNIKSLSDVLLQEHYKYLSIIVRNKFLIDSFIL